MRRLLGTSLILAPVLVVATELVAPTLQEDGAASLAVIESELTAFRLWVWGGLAAAALLIPAVAALVARGARAATDDRADPRWRSWA